MCPDGLANSIFQSKMTDEEAIEFLPPSFRGHIGLGDISPLNSSTDMNAFKEWMIQVIKTLDRCKMEDE